MAGDRTQAIGVLAGGPLSVHQALLFRQWSADVTFFSHALRSSETASWEYG